MKFQVVSDILISVFVTDVVYFMLLLTFAFCGNDELSSNKKIFGLSD